MLLNVRGHVARARVRGRVGLLVGLTFCHHFGGWHWPVLGGLEHPSIIHVARLAKPTWQALQICLVFGGVGRD